MRAFDLAVQARRARPDVDVPDVELLQVPVKLRLELDAVVCLNHVNAEGGKRRMTSSAKRIAVVIVQES